MRILNTALPLALILLPILGAAPVYPLRRRNRNWRNLYIQILPGVILALALLLAFLPDAGASIPGVCGLGVTFTGGGFRALLCVVAAFLWLMTALNAPQYFAGADRGNRFYFFWLFTLGALMGVFLAADLFTLFIFFEMMSFTSYVWVAQNETDEAIRAGETYLAIAVFGGMVLLVGLFLLYRLLDTLTIAELPAAVEAAGSDMLPLIRLAGWCCLVGFGAKAGMFPLHIWLPKAHPVAPAPASALLSGILTKSGVFGVLVIARYLLWFDIQWNTVVLVLACATMFLGAFLALFSVDLKRTLACSSMSQIGFILVGVAMQGFLGHENALASAGTVLHILNHSLIKLVLFVAAGVIYLGCHSLELDRIRGWGRGKPWLAVTFFVGAASICGIPGFSGYVSKTLLHESIVEYLHELEALGLPLGGFRAVEWLFLLSGGLTVAYMTKLFVCIFLERRPSGQRLSVQEYLSGGTQIALGVGAIILAVLGLTPNGTMMPIAAWSGTFLRAAAPAHTVHFLSWQNLQGAVISLTIGAAIYLGVVRTVLRTGRGETAHYRNCWPAWLDLEDLIYRPALRGASFLGALCARVAVSTADLLVLAGEKLLFLRAPGVFVPKKSENFGTYARKPRRHLVAETFSFDLLLAGLGLVGALLYLLTR